MWLPVCARSVDYDLSTLRSPLATMFTAPARCISRLAMDATMEAE